MHSGRIFNEMTAVLISCEHATCAVPEAFRELFKDAGEVVTSSEGWEPGALNLAQGFAMKFRTPLVHGDVTRLLVDLEQDAGPCWSRYSETLAEATRNKLVDRHLRPYRLSLKQRIEEDLRRHDAALHVMVHTDPQSEGQVLLETPEGCEVSEKIGAVWRTRLAVAEIDVRHIRGAGENALFRHLAEGVPLDRYAPVRLSVSQSFFLEGRPLRWETLKKLLVESLGQVLAEIG